MNIKSASIILLLICSFFAVTGIIQAQPYYHELFISDADNGAHITVGRYDVLTISLEANPSTGYSWSPADVPGFLEKVSEEFIPDNDLLGSPGEVIVHYVGRSQGQGPVELVYKRPWQDHGAAETHFSLTVQCRGAFLGTFIPPEPPKTEVRQPAVTISEPLDADVLPTVFNWCDYGACSPVKDQGSCGSCWAFGTVGDIESDVLIKDGVERDFSEQYLLSCNVYGYSCNGGWWVHDHFKDAIPDGEPDAGAVDEADVPYGAVKEDCNPPHEHHEKIDSYAYVVDWSSVPSPAALKQAIYAYGPVSAAVTSSESAFSSYSGGIYQKDSANDVNHAIVITGWNESGPIPYWYMKNSWGADWGEQGYMRIQYGVSDIGFGAMYGSYKAPFTGPRAHILAQASTESTTVSFTDESTCSGCTIVEWSWDFGDGTTSTEQNPVHTYSTPGIYSVALTVTTSKSASATISRDIPVPRLPDACPSRGEHSTIIWIDTVQVGEFSQASDSSHYSDFTMQTIFLESGESYPITVSPGMAGYANWYSLWIDFNHDGDFNDAGETAYQSDAANGGSAEGVISIPSLDDPVITRMRVSIKNGSLPGSCEIFTYGEVEDYRVSLSVPPVFCPGDVDRDFDVDGQDLAAVAFGSSVSLSGFAEKYGKEVCP